MQTYSLPINSFGYPDNDTLSEQSNKESMFVENLENVFPYVMQTS